MFFEQEKENLKSQLRTRLSELAPGRDEDGNHDEDKGVTVIIWPTVRKVSMH